MIIHHKVDVEAHVHVHHHHNDDELSKIFRELSIIKTQNQKIMASQEEFNAVLGRVDTATNKIATDLQALKDVIAGGGLSAAVEAEVLAKLDAAATKLEGIGADPANPVP